MVDELVHQLRTTKAALLIIHPAFLETARKAAQKADISESRIVLIETPPRNETTSAHMSLDSLVEFGCSKAANFVERKFKAGEAKTTLAFLSFSSGTTGMNFHPFLVLYL
jgi:4-coumarate--CoA ligase